MDRHELRIGNLVIRKDLGNGDERIEHIIQLGEKAVSSGPIKVICEYDQLDPVPLSEELLLRFGFEIYNHPVFIFFIRKDISIVKWDDGAWHVRAGHTFKDATEPPLCVIKYVHRLQNIMFELNAEELTLKERQPLIQTPEI